MFNWGLGIGDWGLGPKFGENLLMYQADYAAIEGKIILVIYFEKTDIYEIVSFNSENGDILVEYLIEIIAPSTIKNFSYDKKSLNNAIFKLFFTFGIQKLSSEENSIPIENNVSMKLYPIKGVRITSIKANKNNSHNTMVMGQPQLTGFNNINNFQLQNQINGKFNTFSQPQIQGINNLNTINFAANPAIGIPQIERYFIIDKELFHLLSENVNQISNNNYSTTKLVLKKLPKNQNNINEVNFDSYKIKISRKEFHKKVFNFPENFQIINLNNSIKILAILNNNKADNDLLEEICLTQINGGLVFMPKEINSKISNNLIYIYSNKMIGQKNIIEPTAVIECIDFNERNKKFLQISPNVICQNILLNPKALSSKCYLYNDIIKNNDILRTSTGPSFNSVPRIDNNQKGNQKISQSERFKVIVLLAISQIVDYPESKGEKVYLINPKWLDKYKFQEIKSLVESKSNEENYLWNKKYDLNSVAPIINRLDQTKIQLFCTQMNLNEPNSSIASSDEMALADKYIYLYKSFVLVNGSIFKLFQKYFGIPSSEAFSYIHSKTKGDFIIFKDYKSYHPQNPNQLQNLILAGIIDKSINQYTLQHIFDFKNKNILEKEQQTILNYTIPNYVYYKTCLSPQNNNELFSPIFDNDNIIGNYYQYKENYNYRNCANYLNYLSNEKIKKIIYLCTNESVIRNKVNNLNNNKDEEFYLVKKQLLTDIKNENNYDQLKKYFVGKINIPPGKKELYSIIKNIPANDLQNLNKPYIQKAQPGTYEVDINPIYNPNNQSESYMIYKDFELLEKNIAHALLKEKYPYHILKCSFVGNNTIVFHYPKKMLNNQKNILVVSKIDTNNNIKDEYLIVYKSGDYYRNHFNQIKNSFNNFIVSQGQGFVNNVAPLTSDGYIEIGYIMKITMSSSVLQIQNNNNNINPPNQDSGYIYPNPEATIEKIPDKDYIPPILIQIKFIKEDFSSKPLIGLENIGATCYMNATLQCLCNIQIFVNYFKYSPHLIQIVKSDKEKLKLCSAFKLLIENLYPYQLSNNYKLFLSQNKNNQAIKIPNYAPKSFYAPKNFKETISRMNPLFEGIAANDAKDLVNFLLMTLHEELNKAKPNPNDNSNAFLDQTNKQIMFNTFTESFKKSYQSKISDLFYALNYNMTQCSNCNTISYNYQIYFFLIFPLEEVRKFKLANSSNGLNNINIVDIYDCFFYEQRVNYMMGENAMYCNYCKQTCGSGMRTLLATGPEILIIILNRGKGIQFNVKITFYLELDLSNFIELKNTGCYYELFGVITHIGESGMGGHFIAYCKDMWTQQWLKFNDAIVSPVSHFKSEVIDFAMPYLLFYQKKH